jgi:polar amino acid transport system permease protein
LAPNVIAPSAWAFQLALGAGVTVSLAAASLPFGLTIGLGVALAKDSTAAFLRGIGEAYTTVFRGLPELLTLLLIYDGIPMLLQGAAAATGLPLDIDIPRFAAGVIAFSLVFGAYASEVLLAALRAIERGQIEAALSFGMRPALTFRRIIAPQLLRIALPGLGNNWLVLLKDTSLASIIELNELLHESQLAGASTKQPFQFYLAACVLYLAMTAISTLIIARLESAARRGWSAVA